MVVWNIVARALEWLVLALVMFVVVLGYGCSRSAQIKRERNVLVPWYKAINYKTEAEQ